MAERKKALAAEADIYVINCENLQWLVEQSGVPFNFDMVVLDDLVFVFPDKKHFFMYESFIK